MGTAGPIALARAMLEEDGEDFFVLNSDVICEYPLKEALQFHKEKNAEATILLTKVCVYMFACTHVHDNACVRHAGVYMWPRRLHDPRTHTRAEYVCVCVLCIHCVCVMNIG